MSFAPIGSDSSVPSDAWRSSAKHLGTFRRKSKRGIYLLDEPTTGLHFHDVGKLLEVLHELVLRAIR
jgi:hypothetical protein